MPDRTNSTPFVPLRAAQDQIAGIADDLMALEARLASVALAIDPEEETAAAQHVRAGAGCVRTDLLADAIETLLALASMTDEIARERHAEVIAAIKNVAVFC